MRKRMMKTVAAVCCAALVMSTGTVSVFAAGGRGCHRANKSCVSQYVDNNHDGYCDNRKKSNKCKFTDKNKDGICDNYQAASSSNSQKKGCGRGNRRGCRR